MKKLVLSLLLATGASSADVTLPYITFSNNNPAESSNAASLYSLNAGGGEHLVGSVTFPVLSDINYRTMATYIPVALDQSGIGGWSNRFEWRYTFDGFNDVPFRGMVCGTFCNQGYKPAVSANASSMINDYFPMSGQFGQTGLVLNESLFGYLSALPAGQNIRASTAVYTDSATTPRSVQNNTLHKLGDYRLDNSAKLILSVDPITGDIQLNNGASGLKCTTYNYNTVAGKLCDVMTYSYNGESILPYVGALSLTLSKTNPLLSQFQGSGLNVFLTFDEKMWVSASNGSGGTPADFANAFLQQPFKNGGQASLKMFFPDEFVRKVALQGQASDLTNIATLCISKPLSQLGADFCFHPGNGLNIKPLSPSIEIKPENPDLNIDQNGFAGSGKGNIGDAKPITIPYTISTTSADPAISVTVRVTGPNRALNGQNYCQFSGAGVSGTIQVPVPGWLLAGNSRVRMEHHCDGSKLALPAPASNAAEWTSQQSPLQANLTLWQTPLVLQFPMNDPVSNKTYDGEYWGGIVSAQGTVEVSASWN